MNLLIQEISNLMISIPKQKQSKKIASICIETALLAYNLYILQIVRSSSSLEFSQICYFITLIMFLAFIGSFFRCYLGHASPHRITIFIIKNTKLIAPVLIMVLGKGIRLGQGTKRLYCLVACLLLIALWNFRIIYIRQDYLQIYGKLTIYYELIFFGLFIVVSFQRTFNFFSDYSLHLTTIILTLVLLSKIWQIEYLFEDFEYFDLLCKLGVLQIGCIKLIIQYTLSNFTLFQFFLLNAVIFTMLNLSLVPKTIMKFRYISMIRSFKFDSTSTIPIFYLLSHIGQPKYFGFKLQHQLTQLTHRLSCQLNTDEVLKNLAEKLLKQQKKKKTNKSNYQLNVFFANWYLQNGNYVKSLQCTSRASQHAEQNSIDNIQIQSLRTRIKHLFNIRESLYLSSTSIREQCKVKIVLTKLEAVCVIHYEQKLQSMIQSMHRLTQLTKNYLKIISKSEIDQTLTIETIIKMSKQKEFINSLIEQNPQYLYQQQFLIISYAFMRIICSQKYTAYNCLNVYFEQSLNQMKQMKLGQETSMTVLVSGNTQSIGSITYASIQMKRFFNLKQERINNKSINIKEIMPTNVAINHNQSMLSFVQRGTSEFVGKQQRLIVVKKEEAFVVQTLIKLLVSQDQIIFIGNMRVRPETVIVYTREGEIEAKSKQLVPYIKSPCSIKSLVGSKNIISGKQQFVTLNSEETKAVFNELKSQYAFLAFCVLPHFKSSTLYKSSKDHRKSVAFSKGQTICAQKTMKPYPELQKRIHTYSAINGEVVKFLLLIFVYVSVYLTVAYGTYSISSNLNQTIHNNVNLYNKVIVGFTSRLFDASNAFDVAQGNQNGWGDDTTLSEEGIPSVTNYLNQKIFAIFNSTLNAQQYIDLNIYGVNSEYVSLLNKRQVMFFSNISKAPVNFLTALSLQKSFLIQVFNLNYSSVSNNDMYQLFAVIEYFKNDFIISLLASVFNPLEQTQKIQILNQQKTLLNFIYVCFSALLIFRIFLMRFGHHMKNLLSNDISLLTSLTKYDLFVKSSQNALIDDFIERFKKQSHAYKIQFLLLNQQNRQFCQTSYQKQPKLVQNYLPPWRFVSGALSILFFILTIYLLVSSINTSQLVKANISFYYSYLEDIESVRLGIPQLLNICEEYFVYNDITIPMFGIPMYKLQSSVANSIIHRDIDQKITSLFDWNVTKSLLYDSLCPINDSLCLQVMDGSANNGLISAIATFTEYVLILQSSMDVLAPQMANNVVDDQFNWLLQQYYILQNEVIYAYFQYIYPQITLLDDLSLNYCLTSVKKSLQSLQVNVSAIAIIVCFLEIIFFQYIFRWRCRLDRQIKKEILSFDSVDVMVERMFIKDVLKKLQ